MTLLIFFTRNQIHTKKKRRLGNKETFLHRNSDEAQPEQVGDNHTL